MQVMFNEIDQFAADWLGKLYPEAKIDRRSIVDVQPADLIQHRRCHFFGGIGGWQHALWLAGWPDEREVWTGSCPCPPFSCAGKKKQCPACGGRPVPCPRRTGYFICILCEHAWHADARHLWPEFWRLIRDRRPSTVFGEQVASQDGRIWLAGVRASLERIGYSLGAADLAAAGVGAPDIRQRIYWVAHSKLQRTRIGEPGIEGQAGSGRNRLAINGEAGRLADTNGREPGDSDVQRSGEQRQQPQDGGAAGRVANASGVMGGSRIDEPQRGPERRTVDRGSGAGPVRLGHSIGSGLEGFSGHGDDGDQPGRLGAVQAGHAPAAGGIGFWDAYDVIPCRDGKARRIEPGTFPLAHGVPNRVGRLRGYGNAIVPPLAAEFIKAFLEAESLMTKA